MTIRVGFLGAGLIATYHSKSLRWADADVAWSGVYDPDRERAERFALDQIIIKEGSDWVRFCREVMPLMERSTVLSC